MWLRALFFSLVMGPAYVYGISIVYNYRVAQVTTQFILEEASQHKKTTIFLAFDQYQKKYYDDICQNFAGGLGALAFEFAKTGYIRADFAFAQVNEKAFSKKRYSGIQTDDILLSCGGQLIKSKTAPLSLSGLVGIPTHKVVALQHVDFGYGQAGFGLQCDGSLVLDNDATFIYGGRYIYFVPRHAYDNRDKKYLFTIGNDITLLCAYRKKWGVHNLEIGFTERFQCGGNISPDLANAVKKNNYKRSNFYAVYEYKFLAKNILNRLFFNIGYGFETSPHNFGNKNIILVWGAWNIAF